MSKCYSCNGILDGNRCRLCGAERMMTEEGSVMWIRDGRVIAVPEDEKKQWVAMAERNGIPRDQWPEKFR